MADGLIAQDGRPLRVAVLEPVPNSGGGSEAMSLLIARALARRGAQVQLLHEQPGDLVDRYVDIGARPLHTRLPLFTRRAPLAFARGLRGLAGVLAEQRTGLLLTSHLGYLRQAALLRAMTGVPALFHLGLPSVGDGALLRWSYGRIARGVAPGEPIAEGWRRDGWLASSLSVVPNWVDAGRFLPGNRHAARDALDLHRDARYVVVVGRKSRDKGTLDMLAAFARLAADQVDLRLALVGPVGDGFAGTLEGALAALPAGVRARILLHGATAHPEQWYAAADVACVPSHMEAYGLAVAEAMACAVPVVATDVGAARDLLRGLAEPVAPGDIDALVHALDHALALPDASRAEQGARLRERVLDGIERDGAADAYCRLALQATARGRP